MRMAASIAGTSSARSRRASRVAAVPDSVASHSRVQDFYFGPDFLLRRHDYNVDIAGAFPAADLPMVSIDFSAFEFVR